MRQVQVFKWEQQQIDGKWKNVTVPAFIGAFHQFGQEADGEGQSNPVAIVEAADGQVHSVHATMVQFINAPAGGKLVESLRTARAALEGSNSTQAQERALLAVIDALSAAGAL